MNIVLAVLVLTIAIGFLYTLYKIVYALFKPHSVDWLGNNRKKTLVIGGSILGTMLCFMAILLIASQSIRSTEREAEKLALATQRQSTLTVATENSKVVQPEKEEIIEKTRNQNADSNSRDGH
ncbi:MAG: hypothetical protein Q4A74_07395 [Cardiobacteriaceae bacterium]|nr:hypothetical protein [Cardiobacteriaceae bacterium]